MPISIRIFNKINSQLDVLINNLQGNDVLLWNDISKKWENTSLLEGFTLPHDHNWSDIKLTPTTLLGYGITDASPMGGSSNIVSGGGDPFMNTDGNYVVRINYQQPAQAITVATGGLTSGQSEDLLAIKRMTNLIPGIL